MTTPKNEAIVDNLIDFSPSEQKLTEPVAAFEISEGKHGDLCEDNDVSRSTSSPSGPEQKHYSRLCGYLNKLGNQKILKTFRRRWFVFNESNCKLYYYRSPHDQVPLGEIDISQATFSFDVTDKERSGLFSIRSTFISVLLLLVDFKNFFNALISKFLVVCRDTPRIS